VRFERKTRAVDQYHALCPLPLRVFPTQKPPFSREQKSRP
jgi:hypothetical protein